MEEKKNSRSGLVIAVVANAPAAVVEMERKKQADAESKIAALKETLNSLK